MPSTSILRRSYRRGRLTLLVAVRAIALAADQSHPVGAGGEAGEAGMGHVVAAGPIRYRVGLDLDQGGKVFAAVAEDDRLRDIGAGAQDVLDKRRRDRLAAGGDDETAREVAETRRAGVPFADIAGAQPAVRAFDRAGRLRVVPIGLEEIGTLHQHFAIARKLDLPARGHGSHIARAGKRAALAANDAAGGFGLPVHFDDIDAEHLPERHGFRRQRRAGAEHELQLVEAELVEDRHEHARAAGAVERVVYKAHPAAPAPSRVTARKADREMRGPA